MRRSRRGRRIVGRWYRTSIELQFSTGGSRVAYVQDHGDYWVGGVSWGPSDRHKRKRRFGRRWAAKLWAAAELSRALREDAAR